MDELESETRIISLSRLQNLARRDPAGHVNEFQQQKVHFDAHIQLLSLQPGVCDDDFLATISFMCHVTPCFETSQDFPDRILELLGTYGAQMHARVRMQLCKGLMMMANRGFGSIETISPVLFRLLETQDKLLREFINTSIVQSIKRMNKKQIDHRLNSRLQQVFFETLKSSNSVGNTNAARIIVQIMADLVRRNIWKDTKTINFLSEALFFVKNKSVLVLVIRFLLNNKPAGEDEDEKAQSDSEDDGGADSDEELTKTNQELLLQHRVGKKSKKRGKRLKRALLRNAQKTKKRASKSTKHDAYDSVVLQSIYDPQTFVERLFQKLQKAQDGFEIKILMLDLASRLIGGHKLLLLNFYPYLIRFLQPHQRDVTKILLFTAQATHEQVPPDCLETIIQAVANNFVTERNSSEVMSVGLNTIREIASRAPFALSDADLVRDLTAYNSYKNKNVRAAAQSLVQLFRSVDPKMLHRKNRGRPTGGDVDLTTGESNLKLKQYGEQDAGKTYLEGAEVLLNKKSNDDDDDEGAESDKKSDDGSWIDIPDDSDAELSIDDEDEEDEEESDADENDDSDTEEAENDDAKNADERVAVVLNDPAADATFVSSSRLLTQREHEILRKRQLAKLLQKANGGKNTKDGKKKSANQATIDLDALERQSRSGGAGLGAVTISDIERLVKRPKMSREERYAAVKASKKDSRSDKKANSKRSFRKNEFASTTNKEKAKQKAYGMIRPKAMAKKKRSYKDRQQSLKTALLKKVKMDKKKRH